MPTQQTPTHSAPQHAEVGLFECGPGITVDAVSQAIGDTATLQDISFQVRPGELVAIAGGSGAGKTTLLKAMAGIAPAASGTVTADQAPIETLRAAGEVGYVPQDDIIHLELPLGRTMAHAAALRIAGERNSATRDAAIHRTLDRLGLADRTDVAVKDLSGGQRKRASIAAELLTDPQLLFLDEPTSGLDPATSASVMAHLRHLTETGTTVIMTTHAPADLATCDRVVFLAPGGHLVFAGTPDDAIRWFGVARLAEVYAVIADADGAELAQHFNRRREPEVVEAPDCRPTIGERRPVSAMRQFAALTRRAGDLLTRNRLTLAILIGSPAMVVGMMAVLFRPGTFGMDQLSPVPAIQTLFWVSFASFFFGLTYGLLQIVGEFSIFQRERFNGLSVGAYVASKVAVLIPVLVGVNVLMLLILRGLDRLPSLSGRAWAELLMTLSLTSIAALAVGLLASAAVQNASQATMALPMLCFPQVLFAGAVVPVDEMATAGRIMSFGLVNRWSFEALGRTMDMSALIGDDTATAGYVAAFSGSPTTAWIVLSAITVAALAGTSATLARRARA